MNLRNLKLPLSFYNWTSIIGATIALISLFMIVFLFVVSAIFNQGSSYLGIIIYIALPTLLVIGLILIPVGMIIQINKRHRMRKKKMKQWPLIDFNDYRQRNAFMIFSIGSTVFLLLSAVGSYEAFHYTESVEFCGTLCHQVMKPEYVAYQNSPHARVACVDCHVGAGADWYVRSKLSGLYQVYAVTMDVYPRPIEVPVRNLRPARETCEECHWPQKFYSRQLRTERHYLADTENSEWDINLQMKIGASMSALGLQEGIHWHINPDVKIEYVASNATRDSIPWVRYTNLKTGEVSIYQDQEGNLTSSQLAAMETRTMDCMDCHNRPSHNYQPPVYFVNNAITAGIIPKELPDVKYLAMDVLMDEYTSTDTAMYVIDSVMNEYYSTTYADLYDSNKPLIDKAIAGVKSEFSKNIFPEMRVRWDAYANNIGHFEFQGCFRCHNNRHQNEQGKVISMDCNLCHTIIAQGSPGQMQVASINDTLEFMHPNDPSQGWKGTFCVECHKDLYK